MVVDFFLVYSNLAIDVFPILLSYKQRTPQSTVFLKPDYGPKITMPTYFDGSMDFCFANATNRMRLTTHL